MPSHMFLSGQGQTNLVCADCAMLCHASVLTVFGRWHMVLFVFSVLCSAPSVCVLIPVTYCVHPFRHSNTFLQVFSVDCYD